MTQGSGDGRLLVVGAPLSWLILLGIVAALVAGVWKLGQLLWAMISGA